MILSYSFTIVENDKFISSKKVFKWLFWAGIYAKSMHHFFLEIVNSIHFVSCTFVSNFGRLLVIKACLIYTISYHLVCYITWLEAREDDLQRIHLLQILLFFKAIAQQFQNYKLRLFSSRFLFMMIFFVWIFFKDANFVIFRYSVSLRI